MLAELVAQPLQLQWDRASQNELLRFSARSHPDLMVEMARLMIRRARDPESGMGEDMRNMLAELGQALQQDERLQLQINRFARRTIVGVVTRYGDQIVRLVSETVRRWDARTITDRVEHAVGKDLQFIRINGTLVGGMVGLLLHGLTRLFAG